MVVEVLVETVEDADGDEVPVAVAVVSGTIITDALDVDD